MAAQKLRIFISSPGDVGQERLIAANVLGRLQGEFGGYVELEPILWEHEPLRATTHFQEQIVPPSQTDIVVCILWSRLGTRLPEQFQREDGSTYASGTEWEFEDALKSFRERGTPDLMVYRKSTEPNVSMSDEQALMQRLEQKRALDSFIDRWFGNPQDSFRAAFHAFHSPDKFEILLEDHLRKLIRERLPQHMADVGEPTSAITWHKGSPFRGLEAFDVEHAAVFFGRTQAIGQIKDILVQRSTDGCAFVLVLGMSGSGKSSLVRAGVLPTITQPGVIEGIGLWRWAIIRPSDFSSDIFHGLGQALIGQGALPELESDGLTGRELGALLREAPQHAIAPLRMGLKHAAEAAARQEDLLKAPEARLCLVVDQLEELFTLDHLDEVAREGFVNALSVLARSGLVWVIGTMRSDFYPRCGEIPELVALKEGSGQFDLLPPTLAEIGQMIRQPTRAAGLRFEINPTTSERLDDVLHEAASKDTAALPLLEFTLEELFQQRTEDRVLTFAAYKQLGGLEGALARRAEDTFLSLSPQVQAVLPEVLRMLITVESEGERVARRRVPVTTLSNTPERKALVDAFINARLLVTDRADNGEAVVTVAHEALLWHWPRLQQWLADDTEFLRVRERVGQAATRWRQEDKRSEFLLHTGKPLAEAEYMLSQHRAEIDDSVVEFVETSKRKWASLRRRKIALVSGVVTTFVSVVLAFSVFSYGQWQRAETQKGLALQAINAWTHDIPDRLKDVPGTLPVLRVIFEKNLGTLDRILKLNPSTPEAQREKALNFERSGDTWRVLGDTQAALTAYEKSFAIFKELAATRNSEQAQRDLSVSYVKMGDLRLEAGDYQQALKAYESDLAMTVAQAKANPSAQSQRDLSVSYEKIGDARRALNEHQQALESYQKSLTLRLAIAKEKQDSGTQRDLSVSYEKIGNIWLETGESQKALDVYQKSLALRLTLARQKRTLQAQRDLAIGYANLAGVQHQMGDAQQALASHRKSQALLAKLAEDKFSVQAQRDMAVSYNRVGDIYMAAGDSAKAIAAYRNSLAIATDLAKDKTNLQARRYLVEMCGNLAWAEVLARRPKQAIAVARQGLKIDPDATWIKVNLGHAYLFDNQSEKALVTYLKNEDIKINEQQTVADVVLADFKQLRSKGMTHSAMPQIERLIVQTRQW